MRGVLSKGYSKYKGPEAKVGFPYSRNHKVGGMATVRGSTEFLLWQNGIGSALGALGLGFNPSLAQWVKDLALLQVQLWLRLQMWLGSNPWPGNSI